MKTKKALITGVAGFIGSNLLDYLVENTDWKITGIDNLSTGNIDNIRQHFDNRRFNFANQNCAEIKTLLPFQYIFHLAALPRIQPSFDQVTEHISANLVESLSLLELMIKQDHFPRFVYSSSSAIYGTPEQLPTPETERINCMSPYAFQKYEVEKYLELLSTRYDFDFVNLRYFNPYGPRSFNPSNKLSAYSSVVGIFLDRRKANKALLITGNGQQKRDFIDVRDLARANYLAAIHPTKLNTSFNIGKGSTISILELAKKISSNIEFIRVREGEAEITFADIRKANNLLGWFPGHDLDKYIEKELENEK